MIKSIQYEKILEVVCTVKGTPREELLKLLKDKDCKYLLFLFLKKYKCDNIHQLHEELSIQSKKAIQYGAKKGQEKVLFNKEFRERYFEIEAILEEVK